MYYKSYINSKQHFKNRGTAAYNIFEDDSTVESAQGDIRVNVDGYLLRI